MSSDENEDIPETKECERLVNIFAEVTNTDVACAQFYLQDRKWSLEKSVSDYFEDRKSMPVPGVKAELFITLNTSNVAAASESGPSGVQKKMGETLANCSFSTKNEPHFTNDLIKFISWNIDGLNEENFLLRTKAIAKRILSEDSDIVFLQEVVPQSAEYFLTTLKDYECFFGGDANYFTAIIVKKSVVVVEKHSIIPFPGTVMGRNLLKLEVLFGTTPLMLLCTHLESGRQFVDERNNQLKRALDEVSSAPIHQTVIFGGDLNLRDKEVVKIGGLPSGITDVWEQCGKRKEVTFTWDMLRNDNLTLPGTYKPRMRFDRVYLRSSSPNIHLPKVNPKFFGLIGMERLLPHRCFPSDHWGILCHFGLL